MEAFTTLTSKFVAIKANDIDTDQIIPARFLKVTDKAGLGDNLFCDWRYNEDGSKRPDFILNQPIAQGTKILVAGDNFGCGSSREHAPWALTGFGFKAVISTSFADIFQNNNALKNGLLPVIVNVQTLEKLFALADAHSKDPLTIDVKEQTLTLPSGEQVKFPIDSFNKKCLLEGIDQLGYLQKATA
ncbi:MAG: 3-isopropylmalate dehydratase small subunit, partial [Calditrichaeota bacterium]|nr:3-isopropylmalate dehydratase small subunit [Calditrichota bacterium]